MSVLIPAMGSYKRCMRCFALIPVLEYECKECKDRPPPKDSEK